MESIPAIFCIAVAAIGWYYLFYSRAAHRLAGVEAEKINRQRIYMRRVGAVAMVLLGLAFAVGYYGVDVEHASALFIISWAVVLALLPTIISVGLIDLRLTRRLRDAQRRK